MGHFSFDGPVEIIAHRGYSARAPENTVAALLLALDVGATAVEFDLHAARDGTPVLIHDATLDRTTNGTGPLVRLPVSEIETLDAGSWFDPNFDGEPLPTLEHALGVIAPRIERVYAEIKGVRCQDDLRTLARTVREAGLRERTVYISMDWDALDGIRRTDPEALLGYIVEEIGRTDDALNRATDDERALVDFDARILLANPEIVEAASEASVALAVWTVDDPADAASLLELGVRRFTTNQVERLLVWRDGL
jgi:glycerophosphoryl diester phosphodiesterase